MSEPHATSELPVATSEPVLPASAWAFGWACLAGQVLALADRGFDQSRPAWILLSMAATAAVVAWVAAGVLRARTFRVGLTWIALVSAAVFALVDVVDPGVGKGHGAVALVAAVVQLVALTMFTRSSYFRERRLLRAERQSGRPPEIAGLVLMAVVVGGLGGLTAPTTGPDQPQQLHIGL